MANRICLITQFIEKRQSGFGVARLMMMSGVNVRTFRLQDPGSLESLDRVQQALPEFLSELCTFGEQGHIPGLGTFTRISHSVSRDAPRRAERRGGHCP
jgi:hypothetical protein